MLSMVSAVIVTRRLCAKVDSKAQPTTACQLLRATSQIRRSLLRMKVPLSIKASEHHCDGLNDQTNSSQTS